MKRLSWKYIAGLIDGEGCIDFQMYKSKNGYAHNMAQSPRLRVTLTESCLFLLENIHNNLGGSCNIKKREFKNPNWQNAATWQLSGRKLRPVLQNIVNHLLIKKEQARFSIWYIDNMMGKRIDGGYPGIVTARQIARDELKAMKLDPQRLSEQAVCEIDKHMLMR